MQKRVYIALAVVIFIILVAIIFLNIPNNSERQVNERIIILQTSLDEKHILYELENFTLFANLDDFKDVLDSHSKIIEQGKEPYTKLMSFIEQEENQKDIYINRSLYRYPSEHILEDLLVNGKIAVLDKSKNIYIRYVEAVPYDCEEALAGTGGIRYTIAGTNTTILDIMMFIC